MTIHELCFRFPRGVRWGRVRDMGPAKDYIVVVDYIVLQTQDTAVSQHNTNNENMAPFLVHIVLCTFLERETSDITLPHRTVALFYQHFLPLDMKTAEEVSSVGGA